MALLLLEALLAGVIFVAIVWWVMFSGRKGGERTPPPDGSKGRDRDEEPPR